MANPNTAHQPPRRSRPGAIRVGSVAGVPIYLTFSWLILAVLVIGGLGRVVGGPDRSAVFSALLGAVVVASLLLSVLLHELAHAVTARRFGVGVRGITLELLGGFTEMDSQSPRPGPEAVIALSGPVVSLLLGGGAAALSPLTSRGQVLGEFVFLLAASNLLVGVFNLLPGLPLDGGRALRAVVWRVTGDPARADIVAGWSGRVIALGSVAGAMVLYANTEVLGFVGVVFMALIGASLWSGASEAIGMGAVRGKLPLLQAGHMARPLHLVAAGTPLAEALRQSSDLALDPSLGVADSAGRLVALINARAVAAVPLEQRPWVPVDSVADAIASDQRVGAEMTGMAVLEAVQAHPGRDLLVTVGEDVIGVLAVADVVALLESREKM